MRKIRWRNLIKVGIIILLLGFFGYFIKRDRDEMGNALKIALIEQSIRSPLNQGSCYKPHLPLDNPELMRFYKDVDKINCGSALEDWVMCEKSICFVKPEISAHHDVVCSYTDLIRSSEYSAKYGRTQKTKEPYILHESDFVRVACSAPTGETWYGLVHGIRDTVPKNSANTQIIAGDNNVAPTIFNVLMLGFDSLSRNAFMRKLPKTYAYLTETLDAIILQGYNIVGDGTPQALIPILTGHTELELPETRKRMRNSKAVDVYPMIWKEYSRQGYVTSYNEDMPNVGVFTYRLNGFAEQPVDHYLRTLYQEAQTDSKPNCIGHQPDHIVMLDYTYNCINKYADTRGYFVFSFHGGLSHDSINLIGAADDDIVAWLVRVNVPRLLANTILITMSDHGNRFSEVRATLQGKQEERMPFFSFAFPESFKQEHPQEYAYFQQNAERLTTPFDIHFTLSDILKLSTPPRAGLLTKRKADRPDTNDVRSHGGSEQTATTIGTKTALALKRAFSLFTPIPKNRSCADAYIEPHFCACLNWQQLPLDDPLSTPFLLKLASSIVYRINSAIIGEYRAMCAQLVLSKINWALRLRPQNELLQYQGVQDLDGFLPDLRKQVPHNIEELYQLQITTQPGESLFEASVVYDKNNLMASTKLSEISRVNKYGAQANCIYDLNPELRKYCYCV